jgi:2-dehydro-3-deoxygluconokinase
MLRLAPEGYLRFLQEPKFQATFGGGEANVAVSLAAFGADAAFVTKLPANEIGWAAVSALKSFGVDTSLIKTGGGRMGIYFVEKGASLRPSKVLYDRADSAFSQAEDGDFDWDKIFEGADWFHFTGITPALGQNVARITEQALICAKRRGLSVSCDLNYRKKLWSREAAQNVMSKLMKYVDLCICNEEDAFDVFGIKAEKSDAEAGAINCEGYADVAEKLSRRFGFKRVAITLRESISANDNNWSALLFCDGKAYFSPVYSLRIVDRVGGGDSFGAGLIYGLSRGFGDKKALDFAVAASALKHTVEGDFNRVSVSEVEALMAGNIGGRVQR